MAENNGHFPQHGEFIDFEMRFDRWYRPLATLVRMGPKRTLVRLDDTDRMLHVRHGWAFRLDAPYGSIRSADLLASRPLAWGVHCTGDSWMVNGSRDDIVEIKFSPAVELHKVPMAFTPIRSLWISVVGADDFVSAVNSRGR